MRTLRCQRLLLSTKTEEKLLEVANPHKDYQIGQKVKVVMQQSLGFRALFLGYVLPFVILVVVLFIAMEITQNDLFSGLLGLAILIPLIIPFFIDLE